MIQQPYFSHTGTASEFITGTACECKILSVNLIVVVVICLFITCSIFYVFYEQYLTIWTDALTSLSISLISIFTVSFILTGFDVIAAFVILIMVLLILINMGGLMWMWNISLNAISLVNLVVVRYDLLPPLPFVHLPSLFLYHSLHLPYSTFTFIISNDFIRNLIKYDLRSYQLDFHSI